MNNKSSGFDISEPTKEEIETTIQKVNDRYGIVLSEYDAVTYTKLYEELKQWFLLEKNLGSSESIAKEMADEIQNIVKNSKKLEISPDQAKNIAGKSLDEVISREKERIGRELKAIIVKYK